ncbi:aminoacyl-tRNA deacylase [Egicoccus sp. AB-alg2]|uniref:aminoacyl-tRNA deacylase n=1 Tax=Egicoccus sp. AB-alg2 TaxID=3242693 RepID=UPI00359CCC15
MSMVTEHLERLGVRFEFLPHAPAASALAEARSLALDADEVLKVLVLELETGPALAVIPATRRLDLDLVRDALDEKHARLASEDEVLAHFPEFEPGALPALPSLLHVPVVVDPAVFEHARVTFAAGSQRQSVRTEAEPLLHGATVTVAPVSRVPVGEPW